MALQQRGISWVSKNFGKFKADVNNAVKGLNKLDGAINKAATASRSKVNSQLSGITKQFDGLTKKLTGNSKSISKVLGSLGVDAQGLAGKFGVAGPTAVNFANALSSIPPAALPVAAAVGAAAAGIAAFIALGVRGANTQGLIDAFKNTGVSLEVLREAAAGTIADLDLMRTTNIALAGATGLVRREFGEKLPGLLEIARAQARATGQDVNFLFNSLVTGIKRSSPLLIDNTGLVLKVSEANEAYAQEIGKTVDQLTAQEKQVAILNATLAAGETAVEQFRNSQETAADILARTGARITNIFDRLAFAIQPAFVAVARIVDGVVAAVENLVTQIAPYIQFVAQLIGGIINAVSTVVSGIGNILGGIITPIASVFQRIIDFFVEVQKAFLVGGAKIFGAFVTGVAFVINRSLLPLIQLAVKAIADLLVGQSPPPKGPLKDIDKGGRNVMLAWLEGFASVGTNAVEDALSFVNKALENVAQKSLGAINARVAELDKTLQPFKDQLAIVESQFESLREPAEKALSAIDRQVEQYLQAVADGDRNAAEIVRNLDARRQLIQDELNSQQQIVDQASIQLSLMQAKQAEERTLLAIVKSRLGVEETVRKAAKKADNERQQREGRPAKEPKPKKGTGEPVLPDTGGAVEAPIDPGQFGDNAAFIPDLDLSGLQEFGGELAAGFLEPLIRSGELETTGELVGGIQDELTRIDTGLKQGKGIGGTFVKAFESAADGIKNLFFGDGPDSIKGIISSLPDRIVEFIEGLPAAIQTNIIDPFLNIGVSIASLITGASPDSIRTILSGLPQLLATELGAPFADIGPKIAEFLTGTGENSLRTKISNFVDLLPTILKNLAGEAGVIFLNLAGPFKSVIEDIAGFLSGTGDATLQTILSGLGSSIVTWLTGLGGEGGILTDVLFGPFKSVIDAVIGLFQGNGTNEFTLEGMLVNLSRNMKTWLKDFLLAGGPIDTLILEPFRSGVRKIIGFFSGANAESGEATLRSTLEGLAVNIGLWVGDVGSQLKTSLVDPIAEQIRNVIAFFIDPSYEGEGGFAKALTTFFTGSADEEGTLAYIFGQGILFIESFVRAFGEALKPAAGWVWDNFVVPIIQAVNHMVDLIQDVLNALPATLNAVANELGIQTRIQLATIPKIPTDRPDFLKAQTGGLVSGLVKVGERGPEYISSGERFGVFPNRVTQMLDSINSAFVSPYNQPIFSGSGAGGNISTSNDYDDSINPVFNNIRDPQDYLQRMAIAKLRRRRR